LARMPSGTSHDSPARAEADAVGTLPSGALTRSEVARRLGVSLTTLRRMEGKTLHPVTGPGGVRFFDETEVEAVQVTYRRVRARSEQRLEHDDGAAAAEAFELFDQGMHPIEVVKRMQVAPERVIALHGSWTRLKRTGAMTGVAPHVSATGELAARAFELFDAGKSCREVVIELRQPANVVVALYNDFARL
jgi:hypothetical protein